jgi:hypothetical protein
MLDWREKGARRLMKIQLRVPPPEAEPEAVHPGSPHWFSQSFDPGVAAIASGGGSGLGYGTIGSVSVADNFIGKQRCGIAGCGRERHDPIHRQPTD